MRRSSWLGVLAACVALLMATSAFAQTSGTLVLTPGFLPDPQRLAGISGGPIQASTLNPNCRGWISAQPNHAMNIPSGLPFLRVFAESSTDTTLVIRAPNGQFFCNDDTYGFNPNIDAAYGPGTYYVWVGSYSQGNPAAYTISFSELRTTQPASTTPVVSATPNHPRPVLPPPTFAAPRIVTVTGAGGGAIYDFHTTSAVAVVRQPCIVANVDAVVRGRHTFNSDLTVRLRSPSGESATLQNHSSVSPFRRHSTSSFNGSWGTGTWVLSIEDSVRQDSGVLSGFTLVLTCR